MSFMQPTVARRALGASLRKLREAAGFTRTQAAQAIGYSPQTIQRIEEGTQATRDHQVERLGRLYGAPPALMSEMYRYALDGNRRGWWQAHKEGIPSEFPLFLEAEHDAERIWVLETEYVPGLLQTPEYLMAVQAAQPPLPAGKAAAVRELRSQRQGLLFGREELPEIRFVIGRSALDYLDGLPDVRKGQVERLVEMSRHPEIDIRVITGLHAAMAGSFNILTPKGIPQPFAYVDSVDGCRYIEDHAVVSLYERTFRHVRSSAITLEEYLR
ncbi:helix-turn-helix protein [Stackebrandtia albiflava]|uniref:Helix-turn-helix protein n=1 Tax=Stackebrandtia albiflava TaxID=406432 RepID=A0A562UPY3_9ACTN|nr:helix-turn-helix transcriptional regulator [Stackebrandtia albiflava]TWJ07681.1 helix-turn-helix protein [Stackebrandtia albiflava]